MQRCGRRIIGLVTFGDLAERIDRGGDVSVAVVGHVGDIALEPVGRAAALDGIADPAGADGHAVCPQNDVEGSAGGGRALVAHLHGQLHFLAVRGIAARRPGNGTHHQVASVDLDVHAAQRAGIVVGGELGYLVGLVHDHADVGRSGHYGHVEDGQRVGIGAQRCNRLASGVPAVDVHVHVERPTDGDCAKVGNLGHDAQLVALVDDAVSRPQVHFGNRQVAVLQVEGGQVDALAVVALDQLDDVAERIVGPRLDRVLAGRGRPGHADRGRVGAGGKAQRVDSGVAHERPVYVEAHAESTSGGRAGVEHRGP